MHRLDADNETGLWDRVEGPCLSLYQPTHRRHPEAAQDPIRFRNLLASLQRSLEQRSESKAAQALLEPFRALAADESFWQHGFDGLAVLGAKDIFRVYRLQRPVDELAVVADTFHTKPLLHILQSADRYQILALTLHDMRLFQGNRDVLDEIEPAPGVPRTIQAALGEELTEPHMTVASYGGLGDGASPMHHGHGGREADADKDTERFFRAVDHAVLKHHSQPSGLPLLLAALPEHHHLFRKVAKNPFLLPEALDKHPDGISSLDALRQLAWERVEPRYLGRLDALAAAFAAARAKGRGDDELVRVAREVVAGRVATLLLEDRRVIPGRVDAQTGRVAFDDLAKPDVDDVLDDIGALAWKQGGQVVVLPAERMPTKSGIAAIYRY